MPAEPQCPWRLILSAPMAGPENMALDEALLESAEDGDGRPILRLYAWDPPCLSLGYAQPIAQVDRPALRRLGWHLVRRPTGGRAILHTDELTYAVIAPLSGPIFDGGVLPSYRRLSGALAQGLRGLGVLIEVQPGGQQPPSDDPVCFEALAPHEVTVAGKKLLGSAQLRRRRAALQHGALPLAGDLGRICQVLRYSNGGRRAARRSLLDRAVSVENALGRPVSWELAAQALAEGFRKALGARFIESQPTAEELRRADQLRAARYANPEWTERI
jgi:lipoate-protein ligase A